MPENVYDAIVIGSGISGGWAAKELCEKGLKVIMLERGRQHRTRKRLCKCNQRGLGFSASRYDVPSK